MSNITVEIISPESLIFKGECHLAVAPASAGDVGIMFDHESLTTSLREGKIELFDNNSNLIKEFAVKSGFAQTNDEKKLIVLIDS